MRSFPLSCVALVFLLAGCASTGRTPTPPAFTFEFKFLGGGQVCQVTATDPASGEQLFVQSSLAPERRGADASYQNGDTGHMLVVRLVHEDSGKYLCAAVVADKERAIASERREQ